DSSRNELQASPARAMVAPALEIAVRAAVAQLAADNAALALFSAAWSTYASTPRNARGPSPVIEARRSADARPTGTPSNTCAVESSVMTAMSTDEEPQLAKRTTWPAKMARSGFPSAPSQTVTERPSAVV